jgi:SAM-dependent methyltransferase
VAARAGLTCPACGGAILPWRSVAGGEPSDPFEYELLRCVSCGTAVTAGAPPAAEAYESGQYALARPRFPRAIHGVQRVVTRQPVRFLQRAGLQPGARVLDVGAGPGRLVEALGAAGYDAHGIEPSQRSVALAHAAGRDVEQRGISDHSDSGLNAAVLWHVLEHLDDAPAALATVRSWLRPGGLLLVGVPNAASLQAEIGGDAWFHWDAPRHRIHFTANGLRLLLGRSGFELVAMHHWVLDQNLHAMWMAILTQMGMSPGFPFHFLKRNIDVTPKDLAVSALGVPLVPAAVALEGAAALIRRGGTVAVVAQLRQ